MFAFLVFNIGDGGVVKCGLGVHSGRGFGGGIGQIIAGDTDMCSDPGEFYMYVLGSSGVEGVEYVDGELIMAIRVEEFCECRFTIGEDMEGIVGRVVLFIN